MCVQTRGANIPEWPKQSMEPCRVSQRADWSLDLTTLPPDGSTNMGCSRSTPWCLVMRHWPVVCCMLLACGSLLPGCKTPSSARNASTGTTSTSHASSDGRDFKLRTQATGPEEAAATPEGDIVLVQQLEPSGSLSDSLASLEWIATSNNPRLQRLQRETDAAWARTRYQDKLPDPTVGANIFAAPIETAAGSQRANLSLTQMIPWLDRLDAQAQQACFEAMVMQQMYAAEKLRVIGDVRASYYRLYVLQKQVQTIEANQALLKGLIEVNRVQEVHLALKGSQVFGILMGIIMRER